MTLWGCGCAALFLFLAALALLTTFWIAARHSTAVEGEVEAHRAALEQQERAVWEEARHQLFADARERGVALERSHCRVKEDAEAGLVRVEIEPYPEERAEFLADVRARIDRLNGGNGLTSDDQGQLRRLEDFLPHGERHTVIEIQRLPDGWSWIDSSGGPDGAETALRTQRASTLPPYLLRFAGDE